MFFRLALKNVTRSVRDYAVYFITVTFGVCIFYVFNSMDAQTVMTYLAGESRSYLKDTVVQLINVLSVFVTAVLAFLILYANTFLIRRRKRELGTYLLLGMQRGRISMLLFLETLCIGVLALGAGLLLGVFLSQFISVFTAGLFSIVLEEWVFVFSPGALVKTLLYFGVIFFLVMCFNCFSVSRCKLIDLMQAERANQDLKLKSLRSSVVMFLAGVVLLAIAYGMLLFRGILRVDSLFFLMLGLGTAGTLLFFRSLSGFLLRVCQRSKRLYYKDLNMFILRQFNSKINTTYVSMTVICLMLLLAIGITASSVGLNSTVENLTDGSAPYDLTVQIWKEDAEGKYLDIDVADRLRAGGFDPEKELSGFVSYMIHRVMTQVEHQTGNDSSYEGNDAFFEAISLSDYNALMALQGEPGVELSPGTYGIIPGTMVHNGEYALADLGFTLKIGGQSYTLDKTAVRTQAFATGTVYSPDYLILSDEAIAGMGECGLSGNYMPGADKEAAEARLRAAMARVLPEGDGAGGSQYETRLNIYMETMGSKILVLFIGIYLGIIFLLTSAAVLALQQLSQAADNVGRYQVLSRLGVPERMRDRSVYIQIFLYFFLPLALAVIHAAVGMTAANAAIAAIGHVDAAASSAVTALFILVVYGAYFVATCWSGRRIVRGR